MYKLTEEEIKYRNDRASKIQVSVAGFPFEKEIKDFDFSYQPGINKQQLLELESLRFMENKENVITSITFSGKMTLNFLSILY